MSRRMKPKLSYANVVSSLALFLALGGGAYAAVSSFPSVAAKDTVLTGAYGVAGSAGNGGDTAGAAISFPVKLSTGARVAFIGKGQPAISECPGDVFNPKATRGVLCVYEGDVGNRRSFLPEFSANGFGAYIRIVAQASGYFYSQGTWALVAP